MIQFIKNLFKNKEVKPSKNEIESVRKWMPHLLEHVFSKKEKYNIKYVEPTDIERELIESTILKIPEQNYIHQCSQNKN